MLAKDDDIRNGADARPDLADHYLRIERKFGFTMKHGKSLAEILSPCTPPANSLHLLRPVPENSSNRCKFPEVPSRLPQTAVREL